MWAKWKSGLTTVWLKWDPPVEGLVLIWGQGGNAGGLLLAAAGGELGQIPTVPPGLV